MFHRTIPLMAMLVLAQGCGPSTPEPVEPVEPTGGEGPLVTTDEAFPIVEEDVEFPAAGLTIHGTIARPEAPGKRPAVLLIAGSGPTDRNWNNPGIPGTNGSGRLLAQALAKRGVVTLRYDKRATGESVGDESLYTWEGYLAEQQAALALLRADAAVDPDLVFAAGSSEGGLHILRLAHDPGGPPLAGLLFLDAAGRSLAVTAVDQISGQLLGAVQTGDLDQATADDEVARIRGALEDYLAGRPTAPEHVSSLPPIQALVAAFFNLEGPALNRTLFTFDPAAQFAGLALPVLIVNGDRDTQVLVERDARFLERAAHEAALPDVEFVILPETNHVLKHETRPLEELLLAPDQVVLSYGADDTDLSPIAVSTIVDWLRRHTAGAAAR